MLVQSVSERKRMIGSEIQTCLKLAKQRKRQSDRQATNEYNQAKLNGFRPVASWEVSVAYDDKPKPMESAEENRLNNLESFRQLEAETLKRHKAIRLERIKADKAEAEAEAEKPKPKRQKRQKRNPSNWREQLQQIATAFRSLGVLDSCQKIRAILRSVPKPESRNVNSLWRADCLECLSEAYILISEKPKYAEMSPKYFARLVSRKANKQRAQWIKYVSAETVRKLASRIKIVILPDHLKSESRLDELLAILGKDTVSALLASRTIGEASDRLKVCRDTLTKRLAKARDYVEATKRQKPKAEATKAV